MSDAPHCIVRGRRTGALRDQELECRQRSLCGCNVYRCQSLLVAWLAAEQVDRCAAGLDQPPRHLNAELALGCVVARATTATRRCRG